MFVFLKQVSVKVNEINAGTNEVPEWQTETFTQTVWYPEHPSNTLAFMLNEKKNEVTGDYQRSMGKDLNVLVTQSRKIPVKAQKVVKVKREGYMEKGKQLVEDFTMLEEIVQESVPASFPINEESIDAVVKWLDSYSVPKVD